MTGRKRIAMERKPHFAEVVHLYLRGNSRLEIPRILNLPEREIGRMIDAAERLLTDQPLSDPDVRRALELAKIDHLESAAWTGWDKSLEEAYSKEVQSDGTDKRAKSIFKNQAGDAQFLKQVAWCISMRCQLVGIDTCSQSDATGVGKRTSHNEILVVLQRYGMDSPQWSRRLQEDAQPA